MVTNNELLRRLNNLISIGTVVSISKNKKLAVVDILGRKTASFPILGNANTFKRKATPVRVGEQVTVFCPGGNADFGFIITGMFNTDCKEPDGFNEDVEISEYEDGTTMSYDVKKSELKINAVGNITVVCKEISVKADTVAVTAKSVSVDSSNITFGKVGFGVVTGASICPFTNAPHAHFSTTVKAGM